jgi:hypothetical protein
MPQFDIASFFTQVFWLFLLMLTLYLIYLVYLSKNLGEVDKIRGKILAFVEKMKQKIKKSDMYNRVIKLFKNR